MSVLVNKLKNEIELLKFEIEKLQTEHIRITNENATLQKENTYLQSYATRMSVLLRRAALRGSITLSDDEFKSLRRERHST